MKHFALAQKVLTSILEKEVSFNLGMKNAFKDEKNKWYTYIELIEGSYEKLFMNKSLYVL